MLQRSLDLLNKKSGRNSVADAHARPEPTRETVVDSQIEADPSPKRRRPSYEDEDGDDDWRSDPPVARSGSRMLSPNDVGEQNERHRYQAAPRESQALRALEAIESGKDSQVSGLLRQLPQSDLADEIAKRILEVRKENEDLNVRLSQRMNAAPSPMVVVTPQPDEVIGAKITRRIPALDGGGDDESGDGARTRLFKRKELMAQEEHSELPAGMHDATIAEVMGGPKSTTEDEGSDEHEEAQQQLPPAKLSPASMRKAPLLAPPPENVEPEPPPPSWLTSREFKKLAILLPIIMVFGLLLWAGYSMAFGAKPEFKTEIRLDVSPPTIGGLSAGGEYEDALDLLLSLDPEQAPPPDVANATSYFQRSHGVRISKTNDGKQLREIKYSASGRKWAMLYKSTEPPLQLEEPIDLEKLKKALTGAFFSEVSTNESGNTVVFQRLYDNKYRVQVDYTMPLNGVPGKVSTITISLGN
ncbi:MAG: hypothetical protein KDB07_13330 [Planctomycetes bacterium]|nr:hypothetical protein [Planctomycetota bacterium]